MLSWVGILLALLVGSCSGIGGGVALYTRHRGNRVFTIGLGYAAGTFVYVSLAEVFPAAQTMLAAANGASAGLWTAGAGLAAGMALSALFDWGVMTWVRTRPKSTPAPIQSTAYRSARRPSPYNEPQTAPEFTPDLGAERRGLFPVWDAAARSLQEGAITYLALVAAWQAGLLVALAAGLLHILRGAASAGPFYFVTGDRRKAHALTFTGGLFTLAGAMLACLTELALPGPAMDGLRHTAAAGMMGYLALDSLLSMARGGTRVRQALAGMLVGLAVSAVAIPLLRLLFPH